MNVAGQFPPPHLPTDNDSNSRACSILQLRDFCSRQWRLIVLVTGLSIVFGATYVAMSPSRYTARADMIIDTKRVTWTQSEMASENRAIDDASVESEIETTRSEKVATAVIDQLRLREDPEFIGSGSGLAPPILSPIPFNEGPKK